MDITTRDLILVRFLDGRMTRDEVEVECIWYFDGTDESAAHALSIRACLSYVVDMDEPAAIDAATTALLRFPTHSFSRLILKMIGAGVPGCLLREMLESLTEADVYEAKARTEARKRGE